MTAVHQCGFDSNLDDSDDRLVFLSYILLLTRKDTLNNCLTHSISSYVEKSLYS